MNTKISTDELFHFTKFDSLLNIIKEGFHLRYNLEHTFLSDLFARPSAVESIPMVCFCDIPLHMVQEHSLKYGKCAIGLDKKWGEQYGLSPVIYVHKNSRIGDAVSALANNIANNFSIIKENKDVRIALMMSTFSIGLGQLSYFLKQYERLEDEHYYIGENQFTFKKGRFYDEREWRYVPTDKSGENNWLINVETFNQNVELNNAHEKLKKYSLKFKFNDIKYLICETQEEKLILINSVAKTYGLTNEIVIQKIKFELIDKT